MEVDHVGGAAMRRCVRGCGHCTVVRRICTSFYVYHAWAGFFLLQEFVFCFFKGGGGWVWWRKYKKCIIEEGRVVRRLMGALHVLNLGKGAMK